MPYLFVGIAVVVVILTNVYPLALTVIGSFRRESGFSAEHDFIGLSNYRAILNDPEFQRACINTLEFALIAIIGVLVLGLGIAQWLHGVRRARGLLLVVAIVPWAVPGVINGAIWSLILSPSNGVLNSLLQEIGLIQHPIQWLQGPRAIPAVALTLLWQAIPIGVLVLLAGLESIPTELYEQARLDGAGPFRSFRSITLPLLRPAIAITTVTTAITGLSIFDQIYVLNGNAPATLSVVQQTYLYVFNNLAFGLGFSAAVLFLLGCLIITFLVWAFVYREVEF